MNSGLSRFLLTAFALAGALLCQACDMLQPMENSPTPSARDAARKRLEAACPDYQGGENVLRATSGDIAAIECGILFYRYSETPYTAYELEVSRIYTGGEPLPVPGLQTCWLLDYLHARWRLTGEGWEEIEALARTLTKEDIMQTFVVSIFDPSVVPRVRTGEDGLIAEGDPRREIYDLGLGNDHPSGCGR